MTTNPYDVLPPPEIGGGATSAEAIYIEIGRALTTWEELEEHLAEAFALMAGRPSHEATTNTSPAMRAYGTVVTFRGRKDMILAASEAYFMQRKSGLQAELKSFVNRCANFASRRNDIAHGVIKNIELIADIPGLPGGIPDNTWYLVPPNYNSNKIRLLPKHIEVAAKRKESEVDTVRNYVRKLVRTGYGSYKYNHLQVAHYGEQFRLLSDDARRMLERLATA